MLRGKVNQMQHVKNSCVACDFFYDLISYLVGHCTIKMSKSNPIVQGFCLCTNFNDWGWGGGGDVDR